MTLVPLVPVGKKPTPDSWYGISSIDPKFRWAWENLIIACPMWEGAGTPSSYGPGGVRDWLTLEESTGLSWDETPTEVHVDEFNNGLPHPRVDTGKLRYDIPSALQLNGDVAGTIFQANVLHTMGDQHFNIYYCTDAFARGQIVLQSVAAGINDWRFLGQDSTPNAAADNPVTLAGVRNVGGSGHIVVDGAAYSVSSLSNWNSTWGSNIQFASHETDAQDYGTGPIATAFYFWSDAKELSNLQLLHEDPWGPFRSVVDTDFLDAIGGGGGGGTILPQIMHHGWM